MDYFGTDHKNYVISGDADREALKLVKSWAKRPTAYVLECLPLILGQHGLFDELRSLLFDSRYVIKLIHCHNAVEIYRGIIRNALRKRVTRPDVLARAHLIDIRLAASAALLQKDARALIMFVLRENSVRGKEKFGILLSIYTRSLVRKKEISSQAKAELFRCARRHFSYWNDHQDGESPFQEGTLGRGELKKDIFTASEEDLRELVHLCFPAIFKFDNPASFEFLKFFYPYELYSWCADNLVSFDKEAIGQILNELPKKVLMETLGDKRVEPIVFLARLCKNAALYSAFGILTREDEDALYYHCSRFMAEPGLLFRDLEDWQEMISKTSLKEILRFRLAALFTSVDSPSLHRKLEPGFVELCRYNGVRAIDNVFALVKVKFATRESTVAAREVCESNGWNELNLPSKLFFLSWMRETYDVNLYPLAEPNEIGRVLARRSLILLSSLSSALVTKASSLLEELFSEKIANFPKTINQNSFKAICASYLAGDDQALRVLLAARTTIYSKFEYLGSNSKLFNLRMLRRQIKRMCKKRGMSFRHPIEFEMHHNFDSELPSGIDYPSTPLFLPSKYFWQVRGWLRKRFQGRRCEIIPVLLRRDFGWIEILSRSCDWDPYGFDPEFEKLALGLGYDTSRFRLRLAAFQLRRAAIHLSERKCRKAERFQAYSNSLLKKFGLLQTDEGKVLG